MQITSGASQRLSPSTPMPTTASKPAPPPDSTGDTADLNRVSDLISTLQAIPAVRPEAVEKGVALAADPNYPSSDLIQKLAGLIVGSDAGQS
jgi:hypothetical protein